jgi:hypothetical protein
MDKIEQERVRVLLEHWQHHNQEHAQSYEDWAAKLGEAGWSAVAGHLQEAARLTREINTVLNEALRSVP